ncbi:MAG: PH domain-containing protein [Tomitella sp.]|nr:PH domain-containing protein [Tomitella sp.]
MPEPERDAELTWAPKWATVVAAAAGAVILAVGSASFSDDIVGRGLLAIAAALLVGIAAIGGLVRPRLAVLRDGAAEPRLAVRTPFARQTYTLDQIYRLRVVRYPRLARRVPILEIDAREPEEKLLLLSRWDLGASPDRVYNALVEARAVPPEPLGL